MAADTLQRGLTLRELARVLRIGRDRLACMVRRGELPALDIGIGGRHRYVVLPEHLRSWMERWQAAAVTPAPTRRRRRPAVRDYYPDE